MLTRVILNNIKNNGKKLVKRAECIASSFTIKKGSSYSTFSRFGRNTKFYGSGKNQVHIPLIGAAVVGAATAVILQLST